MTFLVAAETVSLFGRPSQARSPEAERRRRAQGRVAYQYRAAERPGQLSRSARLQRARLSTPDDTYATNPPNVSQVEIQHFCTVPELDRADTLSLSRSAKPQCVRLLSQSNYLPARTFLRAK